MEEKRIIDLVLVKFGLFLVNCGNILVKSGRFLVFFGIDVGRWFKIPDQEDTMFF